MNFESGLVAELRAECADDYVGMWQIYRAVAEQRPAHADVVQETVRVVLELLSEGEITLGQFDDGRFVSWHGDSKRQLATLEAQLRALGRAPDIGEIAWLATRTASYEQRINRQADALLISRRRASRAVPQPDVDTTDASPSISVAVVTRGTGACASGYRGLNFDDPFGLCGIPGAVGNVVAGAALGLATGTGYSFGAAAADAASGALCVGALSKLKKLTTVYRSVNAVGKTQYVGITRNLARRSAEHLRSKGMEVEKVLTDLSRSDARSVEQALIEIHGLGKNGGSLLNRINSIAKDQPAYADQLRRGYELLQTVGYK